MVKSLTSPKEKQRIYLRKWQANLTPWEKTFSYIVSRCTNRSHKYHIAGIRCQITREELKRLWFKGKAYLMEKPSIDRLNPSKNYTFENCQYLEHRVNSVLKGVHYAT